MNFFSKLGHDLKVAGKDVARVGLPVAETILPVVPIPQPLGTLAIDALSLLPTKHQGGNAVVSLVSLSKGEDMNALESFAITITLGILQGVIKNPAHAAQTKAILLGVADDIYTTFGLVPPVHPVAGVTQGGQPLAAK